MAEDTHDQGLPSALRPRPGWEKAARNPEAVHGIPNRSTVASAGYTDPSYQPPKLSPQAQSDAGEFDQSLFKEAQQGHRLSRAASPNSIRGGVRDSGGEAAGDVVAPDLEGAPRADGRPAWDSRFYLERTAWEAQPRTALLRPPSSNAFPGSGGGSVRRSLPVNTGGGRGGGLVAGGSGFSDGGGGGGISPRARRTSGYDPMDGAELASRPSGNVIGSTDGNGTRTTILPGLYAASPPIWASPYGEQQQYSSSGVGRHPASPGPSPPPLAGGASPRTGVTTPRAPRVDLTESYVGRAYSPDTSYMRGSRGFGGGGASMDGGPAGGGGGDAAAAREPGQPAADGGGEGGVDGHGTHLPALERVYFGKKAAAGKDKEKDTGGGADKAAAAAAKASTHQAAIQALGALYMPGGKLRVGGGTEPRSARDTSRSRAVAAPPPLYARSCRSNEGDGDRGANVMTGGGGVTDRSRERERDMSPGPGGGVWRPSGRQPIPEAAPPVPRNTHRSTSGEEKSETQEEADRRRAAPRDTAIHSPERYPLVGQGWFLPPEKFPPNPAYAGVKAKYLESRPPRVQTDDDAAKNLPDIHSKPWLTPGKHLVTDSSAPAPKMTGTAGARPPYAFSPSATGTSVANGTARSNKGGGTGRRGRSPVKGKKKRSQSSSRSRSRGSSASGGGGGEEEEEEEEEEVQGDREVLAVIGGVRLMSIIKRDKMADEARLEAEEDAEMAAEDVQRQQQRQQQQEREGKREEEQKKEREEEKEEGREEELEEEREEEREEAAAATQESEQAGEDISAEARRPAGPEERRASGLSSSSSAGRAARGPTPDLGGGRGGGDRDREEEGGGARRSSGSIGRKRSSRSSRSSRDEGASKREEEEKEQQEAEEEAGDDDRESDGGDDEFAGDDNAEDDDDDDDDGVAAAAAMAGLGDGDGDFAEEEAAEEEAAEEEAGGDWD